MPHSVINGTTARAATDSAAPAILDKATSTHPIVVLLYLIMYINPKATAGIKIYGSCAILS